MANQVYDNFYLSNEVKDQFDSHLDLMKFVKIDRSLTGTAGMKRLINVYEATNGTEKLTMGQGNSQQIGVKYTQEEHEILLAQNNFRWNDEDAMKDPMLVPVGMKHMGTDMFNFVQKDIFAEFNKATLSVEVKQPDFNAFVDAQAKLNLENLEDVYQFAICSPADIAKIRKALKDSLQYVEAFAKNGYVGTVAGINIYAKQNAVENTIIVATNEAVTYFDKVNIEVEQKRDPDKRINDAYSRKYYVVALTDKTKAVKMTINPGMGG